MTNDEISDFGLRISDLDGPPPYAGGYDIAGYRVAGQFVAAMTRKFLPLKAASMSELGSLV